MFEALSRSLRPVTHLRVLMHRKGMVELRDSLYACWGRTGLSAPPGPVLSSLRALNSTLRRSELDDAMQVQIDQAF